MAKDYHLQDSCELVCPLIERDWTPAAVSAVRRTVNEATDGRSAILRRATDSYCICGPQSA